MMRRLVDRRRPCLLALVLGACVFSPVACQRKIAVPPAPATPTTDGERAVAAATPMADLFEDVTGPSGVSHTYRNGEEANHYSILESLGGGVGLIDYDRDGLLDLFATGGGYFDGPDAKQIKGYPNRLYRNLGGRRFRDVTAEVGLDQPLWYGHGCAVGDYDNDGFPDLLVTGYGRLALYRNDRGRRFVDATESAGLRTPRDLHWSTSAAWADLNGDGHLDLFVAHYVNWSFQNHPRCRGYGPDVPVDICPPNSFEPLPPQLFLNGGTGTFREVGRECGLKPGKALGVLIADVNDDGRPDIYVANDALANHLYVNKGHGRFEEEGLAAGVALSELGEPDGSMGVDAADFDGSGRLSLFATNYQQQAHALYRNLGKGLFAHASTAAGVRAIGQHYVGWGTGFVDYDLDGDEDVGISNGHVIRHPSPPLTLAQRPVLLENLYRPGVSSKKARFQDHTDRAGDYFRRAHRGRGVAAGDLDNDGRLDLVISHIDEPVTLLRNVTDPGRHWLGVELVGKGTREAVGARLVLEVGGRRLLRTVKGGGSYLSGNDRRVVFGLDTAAKVERLTVRWPSGHTQTWEGSVLGVDRYLRLVEGFSR